MRPFTRWFLVAAAASLVAACGPKGAGGGGAADADAMTLGNPAAKVSIVEYASVTCPHCAAFNEQVFPALKAKYIDTNLVKYEFREFLTPPVNVAAAGFLVARCAGKDKYFSIVDALFHSQTEIYSSGDVRGVLFRIGRSAGMTDDKITACIQDQKGLEALNKRVDKAMNQDKITGTPTFVINGKSLSGEQTMAQFDSVIQPLLKQ